MLVGLTDGLAAVLLCNGGGADTYAPARYALAAVAAVHSGAAVPDPPSLPDPTRIADAHRYAGVYIDIDATASANRLTVQADGHGLRLCGVGRRLERIAGNVFSVPDSRWDPFPLRFRSPPDSAADDGPCIAIHHGPTVYLREGVPPPDDLLPGNAPPAPLEWAALPGHYRSHAPYVSNFRILLRRSRLYLAWPNGGEELLTPESSAGRASDWFSVAPPGQSTPERIRFAPIVGGQALRAQWAGGGDFYRIGD